MTQRGGQIARADKNAINAFRCGDGINIVDTQLAFDLNNNGDVFVRLRKVIRHRAEHIRAVRNGDAANAFRRVTRRGDGASRFLLRFNKGDQEVIKPNIQHPFDNDRFIGWHTYHRRAGAAFQCH
ncbi:Uncharacterised protein [Salmonella enterica subsp. enterica serovar Typhi]|nr:Uncharacterised protein [Salmonella enterica subsp. enterica serovar Typhi]CGV70477.1 Uncharacterised protein [Salmonella enterica subsp. enterica serovar Typhi]CHD81565.1 Uncharacterised protein [Salmonella enterica subsp. enterica serovar Typhi]